jgi:hypothetical protein
MAKSEIVCGITLFFPFPPLLVHSTLLNLVLTYFQRAVVLNVIPYSYVQMSSVLDRWHFLSAWNNFVNFE